MTSKMPPVPSGNQSSKGPQGVPEMEQGKEAGGRQKLNPDKIGQTANTKVNTTHQGHQQDR